MTTDSILKPPSQLELRSELQTLVERDLLGPAGGDDEIIDEPTVRTRYIVGLLAPRGYSSLDAEDLDESGDLTEDGNSGGQDGKAENRIPFVGGAAMLPSSIGMTFTVTAATTAIKVTARWGRYQREPSETLLTTAGMPKNVWRRSQIEKPHEFTLAKGNLPDWKPNPDQPLVYVRGLCRRYEDAWTITLFIINGQREPKKSKDAAWVFQPELIVSAVDGSPIFVKRSLPKHLTKTDLEDRTMAMLHRRRLEFGVGHSVAIHAELAPGAWDQAVKVCTQIIPHAEVERMDAPQPEHIPGLSKTVVDMKTLADTPTGEFGTALEPLVKAYAKWIEQRAAMVATASPDLLPYADVSQTTLENCREALQRIRAGIELLDANEQAAAAFRFANAAMWQQRVHSLYARYVRQGNERHIDEIDEPKNRSWRPFQLAFVLLNLPSLADPTHEERTHPTSALADLLWFPTGGGKTEAYLGVAAFTMAIRRLQGDLGGYISGAGVTVLMRYTLRLLTLQQFQRAATLIAACEVIRRDDPTIWGGEPFRIGLWVGQRSTPNRTSESVEAIKTKHSSEWTGSVGGRGTPAQLTNCPWCGRPIDPGRDIIVEPVDGGRGRTFQYCSDKLGECPFSRRQSPDEGIPIVVVDEEIYRRLPTLLIATVDKFAQMPWRGSTQMLFGHVTGYCPRHGFRSPELEDSDSHSKKGRLPACKTQEVGPLRPPDLIIQDELHLISGPLGTLVGLYETAVDSLSTWELDGQQIRPKVIASTATIRRSEEQVHSLFLRQVKIFPPSALDADDNFFSRRQGSSDDAPSRMYIGICAPGTRMKTVMIRVYVAYMAAAQTLYEKYGRLADPWMTLVGYFNSIRDLGGMRRVVGDAVANRLRRIAARGLSTRALNMMDVEELTSRRSAADIPKILDRLEYVFDPEQDRDRQLNRQNKQAIDWTKNPLSVVLATNMISVGVDVSRLSLMVVANQPKATAEYIQATGRVGRNFPGLVCTVFNWARPRDLSHYERFEHYHNTFYQHVEALSVTPFSSRAMDRGLSGVLVSYIRLLGTEFNLNDQAGALQRDHDYVTFALSAISRRAGLVTGSHDQEALTQDMLKRRLDQWLSLIDQRANTGSILGYEDKRDGRTINLLEKPGKDWDFFTCLNSLREVEPNVQLILLDQSMDNEPIPLESEAAPQ